MTPAVDTATDAASASMFTPLFPFQSFNNLTTVACRRYGVGDIVLDIFLLYSILLQSVEDCSVIFLHRLFAILIKFFRRLESSRRVEFHNNNRRMFFLVEGCHALVCR